MTTTRVLLVEHELDIATMLELFFSTQNITLLHARASDEALILAAQVMPHAVLIGLSLMDSDDQYTLAGCLLSQPRTAHIPILFLADRDTRDQRRRSLAIGVDDFIVKPFDLQELMLRIQNSIARAARERFTDLRTGLPAAFQARPLIEQARTSSDQAIIEVTLENATPFYQVYGSAAGAEVADDIRQILLTVVNQRGATQDFIGYLDEDHFIILTAAANAVSIAEKITAVFNNTVSSRYLDSDQKRGAVRIGEETYPLMHMICRVTTGNERVEIS